MAAETPVPVDYSSEFFQNALKAEIRSQLVTEKANACPMAMRIAWHSAGTFDKSDSSGGTNGATMRFEPECSDGANAGLNIMRDMLQPVKEKFPNVSVSDIWAVAGAVCVDATGGPPIDVKLGRSDKTEEEGCVPPNGRLPDASQGAQHLRDVFYRMGFDDRDIVALSGGHTLGRCHKARSGFDGPWTADPLKFDNSYYVNLMTMEWTPREWDGPMQYQDPSGQLMMLPTDIALKTDPAFAPIAKEFAESQDAFFKAFQSAYGRLLSNGCPAHCCPMAEGEPPAKQSKVTPTTEFREQCMHGSLERAQECVKEGADVNGLEANSGRTGLMKACYWGHTHMMPFLLDECKVNLDVQDSAGETALHDAARFGHKEVVAALLKAGADKTLINRNGKTAADVAKETGKADVAVMLA